MISHTKGFVVTQKVGSSYWWQPAHWVFGHKTQLKNGSADWTWGKILWVKSWCMLEVAKTLQQVDAFFQGGHMVTLFTTVALRYPAVTYARNICLVLSSILYLASEVLACKEHSPKTQPDVERAVHPTLFFLNIPIHSHESLLGKSKAELHTDSLLPQPQAGRLTSKTPGCNL